MLLTILTVCLNSEKHIVSCLSSTLVLCTSNRIEHILVDGGSTDETLSLAQKFAHVKIRHINDNGVYDAMNKALSFASGKYTLFLNSDDVCLLKNIDFLNSGRLWYSGLVKYINSEGDQVRSDKPYSFSILRLLVSNVIRHPATFVETKYLKLNNFSLRYKYASDYDLFLKLSNECEPVILNIYCAKFRIWNGGLSSNFMASINDELRVRINWRVSTGRKVFIPVDFFIYALRVIKIYVNTVW